MIVLNDRDPSALRELDHTISLLRRLTQDLERVRATGHPDAQLLRLAPTLDHWAPDVRPAGCLTGFSSGHPLLLGSARQIVTSEAWVIAPQEGWVRTVSRFYRLGKPAAEGLHQ